MRCMGVLIKLLTCCVLNLCREQTIVSAQSSDKRQNLELLSHALLQAPPEHHHRGSEG